MADEKRLGRGLESLLGREIVPVEPAPAGEAVAEAEVELLRPNPLQPREEMSDEDLRDLVESIKANGILQPILVRPAPPGYEIIAGERRWQAAKMAGIRRVPIVVRQVDDQDVLTLALIENLQRVDLNPIEKARAFANLLNRFGLTQDEAAKRIGKDRSTIANFLRLLDLPEEVRGHVSRGTITMGHARALLSLTSEFQQIQLCNRIVAEGLSVREVERIVSRRPRGKRQAFEKDSQIREIEDRLRESLGAKVDLVCGRRGGKIVIHYADADDLQRIIERLG